MKKYWICWTLMVIVMALSGCGLPGNQESGLALASDLEVSDFGDYGLNFNLMDAWSEAKVYRGQADPTSPLYDLCYGIDPEFFNLVVRHPNWEDETPYQDVVFVLFRTAYWNQNVDITMLEDLSDLVAFSQDYVMVLDPNYYDPKANGYEEAVALLYTNVGNEWEGDADGVYELFGLTARPNQVQYSQNVKEVSISMDNILADSIVTTGAYTLSVEEDGQWSLVSTYNLDGKALDYRYELPTIRDYEMTYELGQGIQDQGTYRLTIDCERSQLYGLDMPEGQSRPYKLICDFIVQSQDINRTNDNGQDSALEGVDMTTVEETYPIGTQSVRVIWTNTLDDDMTYGQSFFLEAYVDGQWQILSGDQEIGFDSIGYILEAHSSAGQTFLIDIYAPHIQVGSYRIHTDFSRDTLDGVDFGPGNYPRYNVYAYFDVVDQ